jgi:hypothetical protein
MTDIVPTRSSRASGPLDRLAGSVVVLGTDVYARFAAQIGAIVLALYVALVAAAVVVVPDANWDMLPYIAAAEEANLADPAALHAHAYEAVRAGVTEGEFAALTTGEGYRVRMAQDPVAFQSMLPMYRVKLLYVEALSVLSNVMQPVAAIRAISVFSTLLFGLVALLWLRSEKALALAPALVATLIVAGFADAARAGAPDMLTSVLMLAGLYAHTRRQEALTAALLFLAFLARPDNIAFLGVFAVLIVLFRQWSWGALAAFAASLAAYVPISHWAGHPGWWPHFWFTNVEPQLTMENFEPAFSIALYLKAFVAGVIKALIRDSWIGVGLLALVGWFVTDRLGLRLDRRAAVLFAALVLGVAAKFVLFPIPDTRVYFPNLIPPFLLLAVPLTVLFSARAAERGGGDLPGRRRS